MAADDPLSRRLAARPVLLADGATGTCLMEDGLGPGEAPELWNLERPGRVRRLHESFLAAGCDLVLTNTFGANAERLRLHGAEGRAGEINRAGAALAREAAEAAAAASGGPRALAAGSIGPTGALLEPLGPMPPARARAVFAEQARALAEGGADIAWIETFSSVEEAHAALAGAAEAGLPAALSFSFDSAGRTMMGLAPEDAPAAAAASPAPPVALGANCGGGTADFLDALRRLAAAAPPGAITTAKANRGVPAWSASGVEWPASKADMEDWARAARDLGARVVGGCCGNGPEHMRAVRRGLEAEPGPPPSEEALARRFGPPSRAACGGAFDAACGAARGAACGGAFDTPGGAGAPGRAGGAGARAGRRRRAPRPGPPGEGPPGEGPAPS